MLRGLLLNGLLCLSLSGVLVARQSATGVTSKPWEKLLGSWKQVLGDEPTKLKIEPEGGGVKISFDCKQDGACTSNITTNYDGKRSKYSDSAVWEASFRKTGDRTMQEDGYSSGKPDARDTWQLSPDGNTLTIMSQVISRPESKKSTSVYDRSGGPTSSDDPFIGFWKRNWNKSDVRITTFALKGDVLTLTDSDGVTTERNCDGKDHPEALDTTVMYSCRLTGPYSYEAVFKKNEKVTFSLTRKISEDGKKMVITRKNAEGKTMPQWTFEKVQ